MDFVFVPAGTFQQGTPGSTNEERPYTATLTRNYFVSRTEVTQGQWKAVYGSLPASLAFPTCGLTCPVERVSWWESIDLANRLSQSNGLTACYSVSGCTGTVGGGDDATSYRCTSVSYTTSCTGYRLLTESEWERAARGGATTFSTYYWGEATDTTTVGQNAWFTSNSGSRTQGVGQRLMNAYGLYDMSGNVWEWVWDWYASSYPSGSATDYTGPSSGSVRGIRGGGWSRSAPVLRSARRDDREPTLRYNDVGLRLARTLP
jgi:formylglycine-generating enzyme required for sulfatase activity